MMAVDLFGNTIADPEYMARRRGIYQQWRVDSRYRKADDDHCCRSCTYHRVRQYTHTYHKCAVMGASGSSASDVQLNHVCDFWDAVERVALRIEKENEGVS
jgi:hypothetical protein